ncbi:unnamed protein product [Schistosoma margrebowiei]|uniref:Uncharacterized protein n=1 Tax=Schistosoma margrebowiei TaxID=48269 RepID=A0A183LMX8_9TREM|nr:unnamed protein product [Schistosoma margrebowiei]
MVEPTGTFVPANIARSGHHDRQARPPRQANHLKVHESQLSVTGEKGYCMVRATHSVNSGTWYFEATITEQPEGSATRIGWSQMYGNLQAPCGYDKFSYSWRSRLGTAFHESRGKHYADEGYKKDDVIGCMIYLPSTTGPFTSLENQCSESSGLFKTPQANSLSSVAGDIKSNLNNTSSGQNLNKYKTLFCTSNYLPETYKDRPLIRFRNSFYFEEKDEPTKAEKLLHPLPGSKITFYHNGKCMGAAFTNIYAGTYYPAISIYKSATVSVNFGPYFKYPPSDVTDWEPHIDATDDNFVSAKEQPAKFAPIRRHIMKRNYLWDSRLGKRSMNREAFPWYNHDLYNYYNDDNFRGYYTGYDD